MSEKRSLDGAAGPTKSQKRIRIEREIFSKSLHDIETMFNFNHVAAKPNLNTVSSISIPTPPSPQPEHDYSQYTIPLIPGEYNHDLNYDCINLAFLRNDRTVALLVPAKNPGPRATNLYANTLYDESDDDLAHPNLERDLELMDKVFMRAI
jgi:hypothetical protein